MDRPLFRRREILYIMLLALLSLLCVLLFGAGEPAREAVVEQNGAVIDRISLSAPQTKAYGGLTISFGPEGAAVLTADCPDQTCVRTGKLIKAGETAVCLPNRIAVRLEGGAGYDATTY